LANPGNRVHANIQVTIPVITPNHPHQGKAYKGEDFILICLNDLTIMKAKGIAKQRIKMVYPAKIFHENGAWWTYWLCGGNSRYLWTGKFARTIPKRGSPKSIAVKISSLKKNRFTG
jgi:hypothetical protein